MTKHMFGRYGIIDRKSAFIYKRNDEELKQSISRWKVRVRALGLEGLMRHSKLTENIARATQILRCRKSFHSIIKFYNTVTDAERSNIRLKHISELGEYMRKKMLEETETDSEMQVSSLQ